jgi:hypothetical protein
MKTQPRIIPPFDDEDKQVKIFLIGFFIYVITVIIFTVFCIFDAYAQTTEDSTLHAGPSTEQAEQNELIVLIEKIEAPSMDVEIQPELPIIDFNASNYLEMVYYRMTIALHDRAIREGKAPDYYINIFKAQWESEHPTTVGQAIRAIKVVEPACPDGFEIYEGSGICSQFPSHVSAEQNYYHCGLNNYQLWLANADLKRQLAVRNIPNFADGANRGRLWKPEADPTARCKGGTTILLESGNPATTIDILDSNLIKIKTPSNFGKLDDGRPRFCAEGMAGASFGSGPIFIQAGGQLYRVNNPANRED